MAARDRDDAAEAARARRNEEAWVTMSGYETTSGCPCWDESPYPCVPKRTFGYNPNLYALLCCWLCPAKQRAAADGGSETGAGR